MELVWKYGRLSSIPFLKSSIPFHSGNFHIPNRNFHSIFHSIPYHALVATTVTATCLVIDKKQNKTKKKQPLPLYLHAKTFRCCFLKLDGRKKLSLLFHSFFIRVVTVKGYFQKQQLFTSKRNNDSKFSKCTVHCKH